MELTIEEKRDIFWALVESYTRFKRDRNLIKTHFPPSDKSRQAMLDAVDIKERFSYDLLQKFSFEVHIEIPKYYPEPS